MSVVISLQFYTACHLHQKTVASTPKKKKKKKRFQKTIQFLDNMYDK